MLKMAFMNKKKIKILGVTALTNLDNIQVQKYYSRKNIKELVNDYVLHAIKNNVLCIFIFQNILKILHEMYEIYL